jgi:amino-acid N-acetyltransferase
MSAVFNFTFVPWFRSVAPYIHMHRGKTFVVGIAGEAIAAGKLHHLAQDLALIQSMGVKIVLVHGFRPQVNEQLRAKGHEARYSHGMRITDEVALDCAQEAAGQLRYEIEAAFSQGLPNTPMAGSTVRVISGNFITARPGGRGGRGGLPAQRPGAQGGRGRHPAHAGLRRHGAAVAVRLFAHGRGLQPHHGRSRHQRGHRPAGRQADVSDRNAGHPHASPTSPRAKTTRSTPSCPWPPPRSCWPPAPGQQPTDTAFYLQHCVKACKAGVERSHILPFALDGALLLEIYVHDGIGTMVIDEKLEELREATPTTWAASCS